LPSSAVAGVGDDDVVDAGVGYDTVSIPYR